MESPSPAPGASRPLDELPAGLFRSAPLPLLVADGRTRRIVAVNGALEALVGRRPEDLVGSPMESLDTGSSGEVAEYLLLVLAAGDTEPHRRTFRGGDGTDIAVEVRATPLSDARTTTILLAVRDARGDEARERERGRLQAQLWMSQKHEAVGKLAAGLAHDFNNLLSVVMLSAEGLGDRIEGDAAAQAEVDLIIDAGFRARELTRDLLAFTGQQVLEPHPVSVNELVAGMQPLIRRAVPEDIELALRLCDGPATVSADPNQLQQVLLNLVVNARDAMPDGGHLLVTTQQVEVEEDFAREFASVQAGPHVLLSVSDTGIGMDEETRAQVFDPFFTTREQGRGSGLGLATVYGIVKQSGGSIWVTSEPGAGSNFRIYLPRIEATPKRTEDPRGIRVGGVPGGTEHILLVEDDLAVRTKTARILSELGYTVTQAGNPDDAALIHDDLWPARGAHPVDLLLSDVIMPGMSGVELARRIRTKREDLPVVYMSGYLDAESAERSTADEAYLAKPFTREELARIVRTTLNRAARAATG